MELAVGLQLSCGFDNNAYQHINTEYANIIDGVNNPLFTVSNNEITVVQTPKTNVTMMKNIPISQSA